MDAGSLEYLTSLLTGPVFFVLGAFFVMLPFVTVRVFGVVLIGFAAVSGRLSPDLWTTASYVTGMLLSVMAVAAGAYFNYNLTTRRVKQLIEENKAKARDGNEILVPYCKDGSWYHPGLVYPDGLYRIGPRGGERVAKSYQQALQLLRDMPIACWRRPSPKTGLLGMVSATHWGQPPIRYDRRLLIKPQPAAAVSKAA